MGNKTNIKPTEGDQLPTIGQRTGFKKDHESKASIRIYIKPNSNNKAIDNQGKYYIDKREWLKFR